MPKIFNGLPIFKKKKNSSDFFIIYLFTLHLHILSHGHHFCNRCGLSLYYELDQVLWVWGGGIWEYPLGKIIPWKNRLGNVPKNRMAVNRELLVIYHSLYIFFITCGIFQFYSISVTVANVAWQEIPICCFCLSDCTYLP